MAYIVVQHLSPEHESMMAEILARCTRMPVIKILDGMTVEPDHALEAGYDEYLEKPLDADRLFAFLSKIGRPQ